MATYGDPQIQNITEITSAAGDAILTFATPNVPTGNVKIYAPDADVPAGVLQVQGSGSNVPFVLLSKGSSGFSFGNQQMLVDGSGTMLSVSPESSSFVNYISVTASNAGSAVLVHATSQSESNVDIEIGGKGTGKTKCSTDAQFKDDSGNYWVTYPKTFSQTVYLPTTFSATPIITVPVNCVLLHVKERHATAGVDVGNVWLQITQDGSGTAIGGGSSVLSNNSGDGIDLKATANTVQTGTFSSSPGPSLSAGDTLSVKITGVTTSLAGVFVTVSLAYYG